MIELAIAFGAGLISFLSPCVLPLIPGYVSFISGNTLNEILEKKKIDLLPLIVFSLGFSFVFIIFGATASFLGQILLQNSQILRSIAGVIIIIFSLQLIGILNIKFLNVEKKFYTKKSNNTNIPHKKIALITPKKAFVKAIQSFDIDFMDIRIPDNGSTPVMKLENRLTLIKQFNLSWWVPRHL